MRKGYTIFPILCGGWACTGVRVRRGRHTSAFIGIAKQDRVDLRSAIGRDKITARANRNWVSRLRYQVRLVDQPPTR